LHQPPDHQSLYPLPTRRSSDLPGQQCKPNHSCADCNPEIRLFSMLVIFVKQTGRSPDKQQSQTALPCRVSLNKTQNGQNLGGGRSEEHTSELQSRFDLVCRTLL